MNQRKELLSTGTFADLTRLSHKALRLYNQLDILRPVHTDPQTGYRYYAPDQLPRARMIRNLRDMDMPLADIRRLLDLVDMSQAQAQLVVNQYVELRRQQLEQIQLLARQFTQQLKPEANKMNLEVEVKDIPTQQIISITRHHTLDGLSDQIQKDCQALFALAQEKGVAPIGAPFGIYHSTINEQEDGPIETCIPVNGKIEGRGDIEGKQVEGGSAACVVITGEQCHYPELLAGYDTAADWIQKNGFETVGPPREVWYTEPGPDAKWEIVWLFK
jgi:DNA-binding transcriptional MerR regulator